MLPTASRKFSWTPVRLEKSCPKTGELNRQCQPLGRAITGSMAPWAGAEARTPGCGLFSAWKKSHTRPPRFDQHAITIGLMVECVQRRATQGQRPSRRREGNELIGHSGHYVRLVQRSGRTPILEGIRAPGVPAKRKPTQK